MQMVGISKKNVSAGMLSLPKNQTGTKVIERFEKEAVDKVLSNETFVKAMKLLAKV